MLALMLMQIIRGAGAIAPDAVVDAMAVLGADDKGAAALFPGQESFDAKG